jgi:hypothetical protein
MGKVEVSKLLLLGKSTRERKDTSYLLAFGAVVAAASVRFHVGFVAGWVHAFVR